MFEIGSLVRITQFYIHSNERSYWVHKGRRYNGNNPLGLIVKVHGYYRVHFDVLTEFGVLKYFNFHSLYLIQK